MDDLSIDQPTFKMSDEQLVETLDKLVKDSEKHFESKHRLKERRDINYSYYTGDGQANKDLHDYQAKFVDNLLYESVSYIKPIAISSLADIMVSPGSDTAESKENAKVLTEVIYDNVLRSERNRRALGIAFKHRKVYLIGCIKGYWDKQEGANGNFKFDAVHPENLILDHRSSVADADEMGFIGHKYKLTIRDCMIRYPECAGKLKKMYPVTKEKEAAWLGKELDIEEIWFTDYEKVDGQWRRFDVVVWKHEKEILHKIKNPYWDYEGEDKVVSGGNPLDENSASQALLSGDFSDISIERIYHNYFSSPRKPFMLFSYDQWGDSPIDVTTSFEQSILLQDNVNVRGRQITDIANRARDKNVFSTDSGLKSEDIERNDFNNPDQDLLVKGDVRRVHTTIRGEQPNPALYQDKEINTQRIFSKMGTSSTVRGEVTTDTATVAQLSREADYGRIDDETEETINTNVKKMAEWALQFIKLFYTEDHFLEVDGENGARVFKSFSRDSVNDGMLVKIKATGVDKQMAIRRATEMAKMQMIDPLTFFEDVGVAQPKERAKRLMMFTSAPNNYIREYILDDQSQVSFVDDLKSLLSGQSADIPENITPEYINEINDYLTSPQFAQLDPQSQQMVQQFARQVMMSAQKNNA